MHSYTALIAPSEMEDNRSAQPELEDTTRPELEDNSPREIFVSPTELESPSLMFPSDQEDANPLGGHHPSHTERWPVQRMAGSSEFPPHSTSQMSRSSHTSSGSDASSSGPYSRRGMQRVSSLALQCFKGPKTQRSRSSDKILVNKRQLRHVPGTVSEFSGMVDSGHFTMSPDGNGSLSYPKPQNSTSSALHARTLSNPHETSLATSTQDVYISERAGTTSMMTADCMFNQSGTNGQSSLGYAATNSTFSHVAGLDGKMPRADAVTEMSVITAPSAFGTSSTALVDSPCSFSLAGVTWYQGPDSENPQMEEANTFGG